MYDILDEILNVYDWKILLAEVPHSYVRSNVDLDLLEKIQYKINAKDWIIYVDGNTFKRFERGIAFCSSGIAYCDDKGKTEWLTISQLKFSNVAYIGKSLIINGRSITVGHVCKTLAKVIIQIRKELNADATKKNPIKLDSNIRKLWYFGYEGKVMGPYSENELQSMIKSGDYIVEAIQIWTPSFNGWKLIEEIPQFRLEYQNLDKRDNIIETRLLDINHCTKDELMKMPYMVEEKVDNFIRKRNAGVLLKNIYDFQKMFNLNPHEAEIIRNKVEFIVDSTLNKKGRILDI